MVVLGTVAVDANVVVEAVLPRIAASGGIIGLLAVVLCRDLRFYGCLGKPFTVDGLRTLLEAVASGSTQWLSVTSS